MTILTSLLSAVRHPLLVVLLILSPRVAAEGCFDNRFCLSVSNDSDRPQLKVTNTSTLPVVLTVYSDKLAEGHHVTAALHGKASQVLGPVTHADKFWNSMRVRWTPGRLDARHNPDVHYASPLQPVGDYKIVQGFNGNYSHSGASRYAVDFAAPVGTPVFAARGGVVIATKADGRKGGPSRKLAKHANYVAILHEDGTTGEYYHLKYQGVEVSRGDSVARGQLIGYSGNTGFSSMPHLHFGVYVAKPHGKYQSVPITFQPSQLQRRLTD
ncbi:M23 family metallopeptidase [Alteromonas sp. ASW11-19]|uniref:M23 family metallopeptidase n=1 Tax=Alteromonas salexigens TaxID=2982530 RepID=A0ABT2VKB8_9ALTE|nr:M23 family metallopeptidase [Alteromonas salexigens]MCU7553470.1 M23 family metallopeptidase [Alteromonas salexigens]